ncbi:LysE family translocator [Filomicrobium sp.]|uniref:LysE family translocator n=1 Tax=Filomicrobium sp. TaxID=2024831 RepID=UPI002586A41E|nr:LysE family translocator [Filomicrobium sp.]MCV0368035.1 LysE family translocator [Filomicrobium sp.]
MQISMTLGSAIALLGSMIVLAVVPSVSVMTVTARAASAGFLHGVFVTLGIVAGDVIYIMLAIFGLALLTETLGSTAYLIKYVGGAYVLWLGISLWRSTGRVTGERHEDGSSLLSSFMSGLLLTLADQKVVLFYLGFLPAFLNLSKITGVDLAIIIAITVVSVGGVKLGYAYLADRAGLLLGAGASGLLNKAAAGIMIAAGVYLILKP